jgi:hypothetical protein
MQTKLYAFMLVSSTLKLHCDMFSVTQDEDVFIVYYITSDTLYFDSHAG